MPYQKRYSRYPKRDAARRRAYLRKRGAKPVRRVSKPRPRYRKAIASVVKKTLASQAETFKNATRVTGGTFTGAPSFEAAQYYLVNLGGVATYTGQSTTPLNTITANAINAQAPSVLVANQTYQGKEIFGKYLHCKVNITLPAFRTSPVGNRDWETLPMNFNYRCIFFKSTDRPAQSVSGTGLGRRPMYSMFKNAIGTCFGPSSPASLCVPDSAGVQGWTNQDLMQSPVNRTNWKVLKEYKGKLSCASSMSATDNNASVTRNAAYPSEVQHYLTLPINKKLQLQLTDDTPSAGALLTNPLNYDTSIGMMIIFNPLGEQYGQATNWSSYIQPYVHIDNTFAWTDM